MMRGLRRHVRLSLVDGRVVLVGFEEIHLRDQHNRSQGLLSVEQARELFDAEPAEPQRTSNLDVLQRHHGPALPGS